MNGPQASGQLHSALLVFTTTQLKGDEGNELIAGGSV